MRHFTTGFLTLTLALASCTSVPQTASVSSTESPGGSTISSSALDTGAGEMDGAAWHKAQPVRAPHAMVVSAQHLATNVGVSILKKGGNAVDAAVAVGYALAVTHPCCGNIGGGGFMTIHLADGQNLFLDFRERAPLAATATLFQDENGNVVDGLSTSTYLGTGTPGTVMGLSQALDTYGTMSLADVMAPAIALAENGYVLQQGDVNILNRRAKDFAKEPNVAAIFLNNGQPYRVGERLKQPQLAATLRQIAKHGTDAFYKGPIAQSVVTASKANGGLLTMQDFSDYTAQWDKPVTCNYRGYQIVSAPPPSSGGTTICEILQVVEAYPMGEWGFGSVQATHHFIEAERFAFADRNSDLGDPAFIDNPVSTLISQDHARDIRAKIRADKATPSSEVEGGVSAQEGTNTTHYSVVDKDGNAVATTYTINYLFGNGKIAGDTGFFLNNEMDDFSAKPGVPNSFGLVQGAANAVGPGKRPLSSMTPTIVLKDGKLFMVTGSPGGSTIISTTVASIMNVIDYGMNMQQSVDAPRIHHQWMPDQAMVQPGYLTPEAKAALEAMGHSFREVPSWGADEAILVEPETGMLQGANDIRRPAGLAEGY
ncbi:gamma-glutamyltransferase [Altericroceibacterium spongiae]|uniref:Glutathione hydrolase proenzyme n=1 Tax=Altericroceibacterium spongiae TaxID=2320269 RepID=A0A420ES46_9SPHN|nr:gamma-glutamyltransferase [Altericroceibacterium spongiae]RKF23544.1 gamma-glutamyltransferase [Altericroceibacterium spongiae]